MNKKQQGFSLIEALMALLVLTIGVLGAASLQMQSLRSGSVAVQRTYVAMKTQELMDRILANAGNKVVTLSNDPVNNQVIGVETVLSDVNSYVAAGAGQNNGCNSGAVCDNAQMAQHDVDAWRSELTNFLPGVPNFAIAVDVNRNVSMSVSWTDRGDNHSFSLVSQVQPLVIVK